MKIPYITNQPTYEQLLQIIAQQKCEIKFLRKLLINITTYENKQTKLQNKKQHKKS